MENLKENSQTDACSAKYKENEASREYRLSLPELIPQPDVSTENLKVPGSECVSEEQGESGNLFDQSAYLEQHARSSSSSLDPLISDQESVSVTNTHEEKSKSSKGKRCIPIIRISSDQPTSPEMDKRRLSLQDQNQPDREVDQCRRRLSNVDISRPPHHRRLSESTLSIQEEKPLAPSQLSLLPKPSDGRAMRSLSASRIPIQRSRSTPPPRQRLSAQSKPPPEATIPEHESPVDYKALEKEIPPPKERGRTRPRGTNGSDRRRASTAGVTPQNIGVPRARRSLSFSAGSRGK